MQKMRRFGFRKAPARSEKVLKEIQGDLLDVGSIHSVLKSKR